jgi:hypothetical protein
MTAEFEAAIGRISRSVDFIPNDSDVGWHQRLQSFRKAFVFLSEGTRQAGERDLSLPEKQGLIQAFEFTHELAWNVLKDWSSPGKVDCVSGAMMVLV